MSKPGNPHLRKTLLEIVENQLRDSDPPETRETLDRLLNEGFTSEQAMELIACAVSSEIFEVLKYKRLYNHGRYAKALNGLPRMPWEDEELN